MPCCNNRCRPPRRVQHIDRVEHIEVIQPVRNIQTFIPPIRQERIEIIEQVLPQPRPPISQGLIKSATIGNESIHSGFPIPFAFNAIELGNAVTHFPGDTSFTINTSGVYSIFFKINFVPQQSGIVEFILHNNGAPLSDSAILQTVTAGASETVSLNDVFRLNANSTIELIFSTLSTVTDITITDPLIIIHNGV